ncbi:GNAT family N-acetyltransferase [Sporolactobacillus laevolacticus]|uniref:GNAT family N-acetyltransferase n=1 Tax=Sporolactobacillus laevolacticus TaxID=33018 RepID=UPI0025B324E0|nr:GNAT family N-acetyltransferase [Sporolactobacillus laevolacticus]MDN3954669.1 GNAT family N-acetyltransferase [Sporolactobacillus laevolacticus]
MVQSSWTNNDGFTINTNKNFLDVDVIYDFLHNESYWAKEITKDLVVEAIRNSTLCYGIYEGNPTEGKAKQVGFARVVSDLVRFAWLGDVFVVPEYRGRGLSKWLISTITNHPQLKGVSFQLATGDAHGLYAQYGFHPIDHIERKMERTMNWDEIHRGHELNK